MKMPGYAASFAASDLPNDVHLQTIHDDEIVAGAVRDYGQLIYEKTSQP